MPSSPKPSTYVGRLAPSPTGYLHVGHARTFSIATERAKAADGKLLLRIDDLDRERCRPEFTEAAIEDLRGLGLHWDGPPLLQSQRLPLYRRALETLHAAGLIYPCTKTRKEIRAAAARLASTQRGPSSPPQDRTNEEQDSEPLYPLHFRPSPDSPLPPLGTHISTNWRFRTPDGDTLRFDDGAQGEQIAQVGHDFGDFLVWKKDDLPSYQLACVVDDIALGITEVVRGADLLRSTFRQQLLYRALGAQPPAYYHCELVRDETGTRLAKRRASASLRNRIL
ncbi:hypothetical protein AXK12_05475 [Cephaloticoccus capnophilus]|uniref:Glutamyl/glutaminyl-tRNA synthetase class Ib catalytic domain-containing protein n=1 Tax=Cephaloticoccus capnophilus TaxID=1548208 RepID=A0A139SL57_9BACT|nr:tRNA glutamyl-Q(34) synthetase GluQRS [Cephaloticoccus capnophilus]KXU35299.1 hypothetical protein AXK12_05475 [Cephaloticoccus capnophilus]